MAAPFSPFKVELIRKNQYEAPFPLELMHKDLHLAALTAYELDRPLHLANHAKELFTSAKQAGFAAIHAHLSGEKAT